MNTDLITVNQWAKDWLVTFNPNKTEIIMFTLKKITHDAPVIMFGDTQLHLSTSHKHLGLTFSDNGKWSTHIDDIITKASKMIASLRKFKYTLNREHLSSIYQVCIRPHLEYASEVWDGCTEKYSDKLEKMQLEAARIITGLTSYAPLEALYFESGLEKLCTRRTQKKLRLMYKITNKEISSHLNEIIPCTVNEKSNRYPLRNSQNISTPRPRLLYSYNSFVPSTIRLWNDTALQTRQSPTYSLFKSNILSKCKLVPSYFLYGNRYVNVQHTRLRYNCSSLNYDLFKINIKEHANCSCGNPCENSFHFLIECVLYTEIRKELINNLQQLLHGRPHNNDLLNIMLNGNCSLSNSINCKIFKYVHHFIKESKRFT